MHKTLNIDSDGRLLVQFEPEPDEIAATDKVEGIKHLRKMQSTNFFGRSAMKLQELISHNKQEAA